MDDAAAGAADVPTGSTTPGGGTDGGGGVNTTGTDTGAP